VNNQPLSDDSRPVSGDGGGGICDRSRVGEWATRSRCRGDAPCATYFTTGGRRRCWSRSWPLLPWGPSSATPGQRRLVAVQMSQRAQPETSSAARSAQTSRSAERERW